MQHPSEFGSNIRARVPPVDRNSAVDGNTWLLVIDKFMHNFYFIFIYLFTLVFA